MELFSFNLVPHLTKYIACRSHGRLTKTIHRLAATKNL